MYTHHNFVYNQKSKLARLNEVVQEKIIKKGDQIIDPSQRRNF
jgi:hypothetical protein